MKFLIGYLSIYLALGANVFADELSALTNDCDKKISNRLLKPDPRAGVPTCENSLQDKADTEVFLGQKISKCAKPRILYGEITLNLENMAKAQCANLQDKIPKNTDQNQSFQQSADVWNTAASNYTALRDKTNILQHDLLFLAKLNFETIRKQDYFQSITNENREIKQLFSDLENQLNKAEKTNDFSKGSNPKISSISVSSFRNKKSKVAMEQLQTANFIAGKLKETETLKIELKNDADKSIANAKEVNKNQTNGSGNGSDGTSNGNPLSSTISGLTDPNTLMGLASIGASLAPMFMQQSQQQKKQKTPKEKPETQSSSLSSVGKPNNGVGFSQPTTPEVKTTTGENPATPNSAEFNSAKSDISDKSTPLTTAGGGGSSSSTSKPSDAAGGAGTSGALAAKNEKKEEAPKPQSSATDDTLGGLGGGGAGALGYSPPPDHESPLKDILPTDAPVAEGENTDAVIGNGEMENGAREVASEEDQIKSPESLFFRVRGTLSRCQKKGCVSSTAGNAAKNLPF